MAFRLCVGASRRAGKAWGNVAPAVLIVRTGGQSVAGKGLGNRVTYHHSARMPFGVIVAQQLGLAVRMKSGVPSRRTN